MSAARSLRGMIRRGASTRAVTFTVALALGAPLVSSGCGAGGPSAVKACHVSTDGTRYRLVFYRQTRSPEGCAFVRFDRGWYTRRADLALPEGWGVQFAGWQPEDCDAANGSGVRASLRGTAAFTDVPQDPAEVDLELVFGDAEGAPAESLDLRDGSVRITESCEDALGSK